MTRPNLADVTDAALAWVTGALLRAANRAEARRLRRAAGCTCPLCRCDICVEPPEVSR